MERDQTQKKTVISILRKSFYKNGYLLIVAAWLYTFSFIFSNYWFYTSSPERVQKTLENFLKTNETQFQTFAADPSVANAIISNGARPANMANYEKEENGFFGYRRNASNNFALILWSNNKVLPENKDLEKPDGKYFSQYANGEFEFIKKTFVVNGTEVITAALVPIHWNYFFKNNYLQSGFPAQDNIEKRYEIVAANAQFYVKSGDGKVLFGLKEKKKTEERGAAESSMWLRLLAVIFVLIFLNMIATDIASSAGWEKGFIFLTCFVLFFRTLSYYFPFPFKFRSFELFDNLIYASNKLHPSLGDLLINTILLFWLVTFIKYTAINKLENVPPIKGRKGWVITALLSVFLILLSFSLAEVIRSLIIDSKISFDVTNFASLTVYSVISFIILCLIILTFFNFSHIALLFIYKSVNVPVFAKFLMIAVAGLIYLTLHVNNSSATSNIIVLVWLLLYVFMMEFRKADIIVPVFRSSLFLMWLIFFAASISALIIYQNRFVEMEQRKQIAEKLVTQTDPLAENFLGVEITNINNNFLSANFNRFTYESTNKFIKDSLINENFSGYLNKFDTRLYTYDNVFHPLYNDDSSSYSTINSIIVNRSKKTTNPDLYYYKSHENAFSYLYRKEIKDSAGEIQGYFFVIAEAKKYKSDALTPELFKQVKDVESDLNVNYAYAVYNKGRIISDFGDYNFQSVIPKQEYPQQEFEERNSQNNSVLWYNGGNNSLVIIVRNGSLFFEAITLFAWLFGSFLFLIILFQVSYFLIRNEFRIKKIKKEFHFNIRSQIQTTIMFLSFFSFLVIAFSTIFFFITRFERNNRDRLVKAIQVMANEVQDQMATHSGVDLWANYNDLTENNNLEKMIKGISEIHNLDANFYDANGRLRVSTQPYLYKKQILSQMMEPKAFYRLHYNNYIHFIQQENVSRFSFVSIYVPIKNSLGETYAYLNIPYLNTQKELNQEISNFLVTLINLNAFIFLIAGAISVVLTNRITKSFSLISSKMKDINLGKANEKIVWKSNDEINALVNEYNKMVQKLEDSAHALAKSEREGAWREMARQVAHEIKNPLTPMKLSIQYLQKAIQNKNPNVEAMSSKVSATLVEQIDQLAKIASDFSQFADIGNVKVETFDINEVLNLLINLYSANEKLQITNIRNETPAIINADRSQVNRLFTNLFQNAVEASDGKEIIPIIIKQEIDAEKLLISVTDKGQGIPVEKQGKIFTPNFTTKSSGTGLGLAMCKGIVEKANGKIWFETEEGKGTTFFVLLPLVDVPVLKN